MRGRLARRRARLLIACAGQREQVRSVERCLDDAARSARSRGRLARRMGELPSGLPSGLELELTRVIDAAQRVAAA